MSEELPVFSRRQFVVERHERSSAKENGVGGNQPLRLVGHYDRSAVAGAERSVLQSLCEGQRALFEFAVGQPVIFEVAVRFDQADLRSVGFEGFAQGFANRGVVRKIQHYRRDWMREASVRKSLTPCTS